MYLFKFILGTLCIHILHKNSVLCIGNIGGHHRHASSGSSHQRETIQDKNNVDVEVDSAYKLYDEFDKKLNQLSDYAKDKITRTSTLTLNNVIDKNANILKQHLNKIQSTRNLNKIEKQQYTQQQKQPDSLRMRKVLNVLAPYYDGHYVKQLANVENINDNIERIGGVSNKNCKNILDVLEDETGRTSAADTGNVIEKKMDWVKRNPKKFQKFLNKLNTHRQIETANILSNSCELCPVDNLDIWKSKYCCHDGSSIKSKRQTLQQQQQQQPEQQKHNSFTNLSSLYPSVVAKTSSNQLDNLNKFLPPFRDQEKNIQQNSLLPYTDFLNNYYDTQSKLNLITRDNSNNKTLQGDPSSNTTISLLPSTNSTTSTSHINNTTVPVENNQCSQYIDANNASAVLERVLEELELIRQAKEGNNTPEGILILCTKYLG